MAGVADTGSKLIAGVVDTGDKRCQQHQLAESATQQSK
jgi:hypothetical protein